MRIIRAKNIDDDKWEYLLKNSPQGSIFMKSWLMSIVSKNWKAIVVEESGSYVAAFPFFEKRKFGIPYVTMPIFIQHLGPMALSEYQDLKTFYQTCLQILKKKYLRVDITLNDKFEVESAKSGDHQIKWMCTHLLPLNHSYEEIRSRFNQNRKRDIAKAQKNGVEILKATEAEIDDIINCFDNTIGFGLEEIKTENYTYLKQIMMHCLINGEGKIYKAVKENSVVAASFFTYYKNTITYLLGTSTEAGKKMGAQTFIFNYLINNQSNTPFVLDFEGSLKPTLAKYYSSFGAVKKHFPHYRFKKLL